MERVCEELDEAKAEIEKLKAEYQRKAESSESFKKAYNEQLTKLKELSSKFNQQSQELNEKSEEASMAKQMYEELKCCLNEKESIIKHLRAANDRLQVDCDEKFRKWEEENRKQVLALDEANEKNMDQEQKIHLFKEEIEGLKRLLSVSQKKCLEAEKNAKASEELRQRDDMLVKSEEQNRRIEDQLKWKKEQFNHLEEAHEKLRNQFRTSKKEWEREVSTLLDKICSLQSKLDSQTQISEGFQSQLQICNQALAQEERQRKYLEIQLSETKTCFENVFSECEGAKSKIEHLSIQRDKEIAALRNSLSTKETLYKEADFRARKLEHENQELLMSLKELQEERIHEAGASSSLAKLRNKLKSLERMHRDCSENLRAKEAQWSSQLEKLTGDLNDYMLKLESKDAIIKELGLELEGCYSSIMQLKLQNEELELRATKLEQDNQELQMSLEELQEEGIHESGTSSLAGLQNKVESLEHIHRDCSSNLRAKEAEWSSQLEKLTGDLSDCKSKLESKDAVIRELSMELEGCYSSLVQLKLQSEEASLMVLVLKLGFSEAQLKLANEKDEMDLQKKESEENISLLMNKLEMKSAALVKTQADIEEEREKVVSLLRRVELLELFEQQQLLTQKELERHKEMLEESSKYQLHQKEQALQMESNLKARLEELTGDLSDYKSKLESKDAVIRELSMELEGCYSSLVQLKLQSEEASLMVLVLKLGFSEAQLKLANEKDEMDLQKKEREENISLLMNKLEMKSAALVKAQADIEEEREKVVSLLRRVELLELFEQQQLLMQKELERHKEMLEESSKYQLHQKEQALQMESNLKARLEEACDDLDRANSELVKKAQADTEKEREKVASLLRRVESFEQQQLLMQKELERHKEMLEESSKYQLHLKEQCLQMESNLKARLREACDALHRANSELSEKICEGSEAEFELQIWKSIADRLKAELEENLEMRRAIEASLLAQVEVEETLKQERDGLINALEERDRMIDEFQQQIRSLDQEMKAREIETAGFARTEAVMAFELEKGIFLQTTKEKDRILEKLQEEIEWLEHESLRRELEGSILAQIVTEKTFEHEKSNLIQLVEEKEERVEDLQKLVRSLEQNFNSSMISFSSQLVQKQAEINLVHEAWEKIATADILAQLEIEEKKLMIMELEDGIHSIQQKLEFQEKSSSNSKKQASEIEAELEAKKLEVKKLTTEMETKLSNSEGLVNELEREKKILVEKIAELLSERENLLGFIGDMCDGINKFSSEDMQLTRSLERIMHTFDTNSSGNDLKRRDDTSFHPNKENFSTHLSPTMKLFEAIPDERSPFREVNN